MLGEEIPMGQLGNIPSSWNTDSEAFILVSEHRPNLGPNLEADDIPVINLAPFFDVIGVEAEGENWSAIGAVVEHSKDPTLRSLVAEIGNACAEWGFFQVVDHKISPELLRKVMEAAKGFFSLPLEEKKKVGRSFERPLGYNDSELTKNARDWKEVFDWAPLGYYEMPETVDSDYRSGRYSNTTLKSYNQWPAMPDGFREACETYTEAVVHLSGLLLGLISVSLGLPYDVLHHYFDKDNTIQARLNHYPHCPLADLVCGVNRHVDSGALTVLAQDSVGGLQVKRKDGQWVAVKPREDAFVVNVGAILQVWSNDKYRGVEHRVSVNERKERFSIPVFYDPSIKTDVFPLPQLLDEEHPAQYQSYNWGFFRRTRNNGNFKQLGENIQIHHYRI